MAEHDIDLDAIKAARLETVGKVERKVLFAGKSFLLSPELPWDIAEGLATDDYDQIVSGIKQLLGAKWEDFRALGPSTADVVALGMAASRKFGMNSLGESRASEGTSSRTSRRSRQTSTGTTGSTSRKPSGAKSGSRSGRSGRS